MSSNDFQTCGSCGGLVHPSMGHTCVYQPRQKSLLPNGWLPRASGFDAPPGAGTFEPAAPLTEERVRQIVREELAKREGAK